ncbi:MAG: hypothetical protein Q9175_002020 [Cornicularia normoerica]
MERPPYTGIKQWATMQQAAEKGPATTSNLTVAVKPESTPRTRPQQQPADPPQPAPSASQPQTLWQVAVCKDRATPTAVCGRYSTALNDLPIPGGGTGPYRCPRCHGGFSRIDSVRQHSPKCIALNGNPNCLAWTDDGSYAAAVAARSATRVDGRVIEETRKPRVRAAHFVTLGVSEVAIRVATHCESHINGLDPSSGELPPSDKTKEEEDKAWKEIVKNLKEETRNAQKISPEAKAMIETFKKDGMWDSEPSDET